MKWTGENGIASFLGEIYGDTVKENSEFVDACEEGRYTEDDRPMVTVAVCVWLNVPIPAAVWDEGHN